jgi:predicted nucleic acid-binding protein
LASDIAKLVEIDYLVALDARKLIRDARFTYGFSLKPADALHLASCRRLGVDEFHTYDPQLGRYQPLTKLKVCEPSVVQPSLFQQPMPRTKGPGTT